MLDLSYNDVSDVGAYALAHTPYLQKLCELYLEDNEVHEEGWYALLESPVLSHAVKQTFKRYIGIENGDVPFF